MIDKVINNILGKTKMNKKNNKKCKEPSFNDVKQGLGNIVKPFKDLYDKGVKNEEKIIKRIKK